MKTFSKYIQDINEMAHMSGILDSKSYSLKKDFDKYKNSKSFKLQADKIGSMNYSLYKSTIDLNEIYFLTENDEYRGQITFMKDGNSLIIKTSHKEKSVKGFYNILFTIILNKNKSIEIVSDNNLSTQAFKSYMKLSKNKSFILKTKTMFGYEEFTKENIEDSMFNRVSLSLKNFVLEEYYNKINDILLFENHYKKMFQENDETLEQILMGENWKLI
jgi:hypothetical protein